MRISLLSYQMPELGGQTSGVFSKIPRHDSNHDKRYFDTTYKDSYTKRFRDIGFIAIDSKTFHRNNIFAGANGGIKKNEKIRITTQLISEKYNSNFFNIILIRWSRAKT